MKCLGSIRRIVAVATMSIAFVSTAGGGQQNPNDVHQLTSPIPNGRFEIVQSQIAARWTFRLDRFTGRVDQLTSTPDDGVTWQPMPVLGLATLPPSKPRFQIFLSGIAARLAFLIGTETGVSWRLVTSDERDASGKVTPVALWAPFVLASPTP